MDIPSGCLPKKFSHLLFGRLESLSNESHFPYRGDRIYIKPEQYGLQQFGHYLMRKCTSFVFDHRCLRGFFPPDSSHYIRVVIQNSFCRMADHWNRNLCKGEGTFHEWIDRPLIRKWTEILSTFENITREERREMEELISRQGIREIYRQTFLVPFSSNVN